MVRILLFIKHRLGFVWNLIEYLNGLVFGMLYGKKISSSLNRLFGESNNGSFVYRKLKSADIPALEAFFAAQHSEQFSFFRPHKFDLKSLMRLNRNPSFLMMGVFEQNEIVGYFFLRFFVNKKCFIGRIVDGGHQRQGIARSMNHIMYQTAWQNGFRCLSTISRQNSSIYNFHKADKNFVVLKELPNDYLLVEIKNPG